MAKLIQGNCLDYLETIQQADALVSDPPYGCSNKCDYTRFSGGRCERRNNFKNIAGDDSPFDPTPFLSIKHVALFGYQFFAEKLPVGTICVWLKKRDNQLGSFCSDAELCWLNRGKGVYVHRHIWNGFDRETERGKTLHPTQKPVALMEWIIDKMKLPLGATIADPYMGCGSVGVAAINKGFHFIGCELEKSYFDIAQRRIIDAENKSRQSLAG